jgi:membrane protease YdiL (CAAX protease family)
VGITIYDSNIKNTADVIIKTPLMLLGRNGSLIFNLLVIVLLIVSVFYIEKEYRFSPLIFFPMLMESVIYTLLLGFGLGYVVYRILLPYILAKPFSANIWMGIILSIGAGVYEEIVFRFLLITSLYFVFTALLKINKLIGAILSIVLSTSLFTIMHYVGTLGDSFTYANVTFRFLSGIILSIIFMSRGLGITVYTHAIYDMLLVLKPFSV